MNIHVREHVFKMCITSMISDSHVSGQSQHW